MTETESRIDIPIQFVSPELHDIHPDIGDATGYFWNTLKQRIFHFNANAIIEIIGMPGLSKSWSGLEITDQCNKWGGHKFDPTRQVSFSYEHCLEQLQPAFDGQCFMSDERPRTTGVMSETEEEAFQNVLDIIRKRRISLVLISPTERNLDFYMFRLTSLSLMYTARVAIFKCSVRERIYGLVQIPAPRKALIPPYERAKDEFLKRMLEQGGITGIDLQKIADRLMEDPKILRCKGGPKNQLRAVLAVEIKPPLNTTLLGIMTDYIHGRWAEEQLAAMLAEGQAPKKRQKRR